MAASTPREKSLALVSRIVSALDDKKATDIRIIDVSAQSGVTDFFVIATGAADQHLRSLRIELDRVFDEDQVKLVGVESQGDSGWIVIDAFDVMVQLFSTHQRNNYQFEKLWKDGVELPLSKFLKTVTRTLPEQAVLISGNSKTPAEKKVAVVAKKPAAKAPAKKAAAPAKKAAPAKAAPVKKAAEKAPIVKKGVKAIVTGEARIVRRAHAKAKATRLAVEEAAKPKVIKPLKEKTKKIIAKKGAKAAKIVRGAINQKAKAAKLIKVPAKSQAKAGVVTRKAKRA